ncbi:hypothetical protein DDB_G0293506 [Dictyostelium discoideum AX4]|uniref:Transmembrane protein n=1 Tax=Dictyostelium discoideum TaxID=44689 RepID=Q54BQ1_DICDI|nr:hypothetical protein DDB_G0293506 [Dictyostelium discoideum AX4]EAL60688.1 hypothetical protein DDB_G0293506 [Dictyostelium discoideum AX4]|eukprot:XP_629101.1 hypothetical protein DDB_G0293506 [Dictyostelium discoideum AX4]
MKIKKSFFHFFFFFIFYFFFFFQIITLKHSVANSLIILFIVLSWEKVKILTFPAGVILIFLRSKKVDKKRKAEKEADRKNGEADDNQKSEEEMIPGLFLQFKGVGNGLNKGCFN